MDIKHIAAFLIIILFIIFVVFPVFIAGENAKYTDSVKGGALLVGCAGASALIASAVFWAIEQLGAF